MGVTFALDLIASLKMLAVPVEVSRRTGGRSSDAPPGTRRSPRSRLRRGRFVFSRKEWTHYSVGKDGRMRVRRTRLGALLPNDDSPIRELVLRYYWAVPMLQMP